MARHWVIACTVYRNDVLRPLVITDWKCLMKKNLSLAWAWVLVGVMVGGCSQTRQANPESAAANERFGHMQAGSVLPTDAKVATTASMAQAQRSIIRRGTLMIKVTDLEETKRQAMRYVNQAGGFVEAESSSNLTRSISEIQMTLRVPVGKFEAAMEAFNALGVAMNRSVSAEDITSQVVDLTARLRVMRAQEEVYIGLLKQSKTLKDSMAVQDRLMELRQEIESLDAQLKSQSELASLSTIELTMRTDTKPAGDAQSAGWAQESWTAATNSLGAVMRDLGRMIIGLAVFAPIWLPILGLFVWAIRRAGRKTVPPPVQ